MVSSQIAQPAHPFPPSWERVADLRVFRTTQQHWHRLIGWRSEMRKKGWRLLRVSSSSDVLVAVFGRTKAELLSREDG